MWGGNSQCWFTRRGSQAWFCWEDITLNAKCRTLRWLQEPPILVFWVSYHSISSVSWVLLCGSPPGVYEYKYQLDSAYQNWERTPAMQILRFCMAKKALHVDPPRLAKAPTLWELSIRANSRFWVRFNCWIDNRGHSRSRYLSWSEWEKIDDIWRHEAAGQNMFKYRYGCSLLASSDGAKPFPGFQNFIHQNATIFLIPANEKETNHSWPAAAPKTILFFVNRMELHAENPHPPPPA